MNISKQFLMVLVVALLTFSCSPLRGKKAIVVNDDGRSMRYNNGRAEGNTKRWNSTRSLGKQQKKRNKAFRKRRRN
ncbi:hypothetical protein [Pontibacter pamirensis]|uniref:hypothetical protein n=1 Tax=Pontibacter pamirensis TaxID=2562824 RepID=UPI00138A2A36|nr:hypothetical protein [Pontibacter pamirensis]